MVRVIKLDGVGPVDNRLKQARGWFAGEGRVSAIGDARRFQGYE